LLDHELPQMLVTDLRMGGMDGLQLFETVHRRHPLLPVLILTAHGTIPDAVKALQRGVFGYVTKPFEAQALMAEVDRALAASMALGANMPMHGGGGEGGEGSKAQGAWRESIITRSPRMARLLAGSRLMAQSDASVLIHSASGTGKELPARAIHAASQRAREVRPVGATRAPRINVRVISASHHVLEGEVAADRFREDLFYRPNVVGLTLPPLAERREDIALMAQHFMVTLSQRYGKAVAGFAPGALELLGLAPWPGNVRQLQNVVKKCVVLSTGPLIAPSLVQRALANQSGDMPGFDEARRQFERDYLTQLLKITAVNVTQAARLAQRNRTDFYSLMSWHQLDPASFKAGCPGIGCSRRQRDKSPGRGVGVYRQVRALISL
jgi:two-component system response regulator GlrR